MAKDKKPAAAPAPAPAPAAKPAAKKAAPAAAAKEAPAAKPAPAAAKAAPAPAGKKGAAAPAAAGKKAPAKKEPKPKPLTKGELFGAVAGHVSPDTTKVEVEKFYDALVMVITAELKKPVHMIQLPDLFRLIASEKAAVKGGETKTNPLNGSTYVTKDKPATLQVKARVLKVLKDALGDSTAPASPAAKK